MPPDFRFLVKAERVLVLPDLEDGRQAQVFRSPHRYIWPSELDLMARLAGFQLESRWADWNRTPFTAESGSHVSVYRLDAR